MRLDWQPIETVPRDMRSVLVWLSKPHNHSRVHAAYFAPNFSRGVISGSFGFDLDGAPTHWAELPLGPPEEPSEVNGD